jgi:hypothetical protein
VLPDIGAGVVESVPVDGGVVMVPAGGVVASGVAVAPAGGIVASGVVVAGGAGVSVV